MSRTIEELYDDLINLMSIKKGNPALLIHKLRQIRAAEATFKTIEADTGDATAETSDDTFTISGGDNVSTSITDTTLTIDIGLFMEYKGTLDASSGVYPTSPEKGDYWVISVGGNIGGTAYVITDWAVYNGSSWDKIDNTQAAVISDDVFAVGWNDDTSHAASKNALYDYLSAISITNMPAAVNNWKVFCTNGSGTMTEIATGAANTVFTGNGVAAAPSFQAPAVGGWTIIDAIGDLQAALDAGGAILLKAGTYALTATLDIDQNKSVILQGEGDETIIDINGNYRCFDITAAESCVLRDFKIDATDLTTNVRPVIDIREGSDNKVLIDNIMIIGDGLNGNGIECNSKNIIIKNCYINSIYTGIVSNDNNITITNNQIISCDYAGIYISAGDYLIISCNIISLCNIGMEIITSYSCIENNIVHNSTVYGITISTSHYNSYNGNSSHSNGVCGIRISSSDNNTLTGNNCNVNNLDNAANGAGIWIDNDADYNTISGNTCNGNANIGVGIGYGINIANANCDDNTVMGNTALNNDTNYQDLGTNTFDTDGAGQSLNNIA